MHAHSPSFTPFVSKKCLKSLPFQAGSYTNTPAACWFASFQTVTGQEGGAVFQLET